MAEATIADHQPLPPSFDDSIAEFDALPIPPLDSMFLSSGENLASGLSFLDEGFDLDLLLDDHDVANLLSEDEDGHFPDPNSAAYLDLSRLLSDSASPEAGSSGISDDVVKHLNCSPSESRCYDYGDQSCNLNSSSPASSGYRGSGMSEAANLSSPEPDSAAFVVNQKIEVEDANVKRCSLPKRKIETSSDDTSRNQKFMRSEISKTEANNSNSHCSNFVAVDEEDDKRKARLIRNRESAQLSRQRKKQYIEELEDKVRSMHSTIADLNGKVSYFMAENAALRQQLSGNGMCAPPLYPPMAPMPYPWMPCAPYVVKPQGSQVPLVPIPRLKPQKIASASKSKKDEGKKAGGKSKKVASVSFLGLLFFVFLFGGMVPILNVKYGGVKEYDGNGVGFVSDKFYDTHRGRILMVDGHRNGSDEKMDIDKFHCGGGRGRVEDLPNLDEFANLNGTKKLAASLYVPRNDQLVKIDGDLIIHSVLATEKAMASHGVTQVNKNDETSLAIPGDLSRALAIPKMHSRSDVSSDRGVLSQRYGAIKGHNALPSSSSDTLKDHLKSSAANGELQQQWFHQGVAGPFLSSGLCTEVFRFDATATSGAIVPVSSVVNMTTEHQQNSTRHTTAKNRRFLHGLQIPPPGSNLSSPKDEFQGKKSVSSSMVVSVFLDPQENNDIDVDGVIKPKSLSRIFVVVLLDSVKYVTYKCMLPLSGSRLVTN